MNTLDFLYLAQSGDEMSLLLREDCALWPDLGQGEWSEKTFSHHEGEWVRLSELTHLDVPSAQSLCGFLGNFWKFAGGAYSHIKLPEFLDSAGLQSEMKYLTFYGGSFNPWHLGHRECVEQGQGKNLLVYPDLNPHKSSEQKKNPWSVVKDLVEKLQGLKYSLFPGFLEGGESNPTVNWVEKIEVGQIDFLMGDDQFLNLSKWTRYQDLLKKISKILVVPRELNPEQLQIKREEFIKEFPSLEIEILKAHPYQHLSSTNLR